MTRYKSKEAYQNYIQGIQEYNRKAYRQYGVRINKNTNQELIDYCLSLPNFQGYLTELIREDMRKHGIEV